MARRPGKRVGDKVYVHRDYATLHMSERHLKWAEAIAEDTIEGYTCVRINKMTGEVAFQFSPDFDLVDEPTVGKTVTVRPDRTMKITSQAQDPFIWHHKWMWVADDYQGFDVQASKERSKLWEEHVTKKEKCKIGRRSYWEKVRKRWE